MENWFGKMYMAKMVVYFRREENDSDADRNEGRIIQSVFETGEDW